MLIIDVIIVLILVAVGYMLDDYFNLTALYITPPVAGGVIGIIVNLVNYAMTGSMWLPHQFGPQLLITIFLFSIGVKIALTYGKKHLISLFNLFWITVVIMFIIDAVAIMTTNNSVSLFAFGSSSLAWNGAWLNFIQQVFPNLTTIQFYFHASLLAAFLLAPVVVKMFVFFEVEEIQNPARPQIGDWHWGVVIVSLFLALTAIFMRTNFLAGIPYLFSFIIAMWLGIIVGLVIDHFANDKQDQMLTSIGELGLLSLYGFIVSMLLKSTNIVVTNWNLRLLYLLIIKIIIITVIHIILAKLLVKDHHDLVLMGACWAFTLSAPVACMNTMNSIVRYHGEADDVLLLVPPIVLWLINYAHYGVFIWLLH
ncbi:hypothetical protein [Halanaerobacter jeridensis]|nr:hypothetical protein [Halanaerobacter jeridensis]